MAVNISAVTPSCTLTPAAPVRSLGWNRFDLSCIRFANKYDRFMKAHLPYSSELFRIISGALRLDASKVRNYTAFLADKLDADGDTSTAKRLRKMLDETDHQLVPAAISNRTLPVDGETRFPLVERVVPKSSQARPPQLTPRQEDAINEFVSVVKSHSQFQTEELDSSLGLLLYGPPGCGKTHLAYWIAAELGLPLLLARLDGVISSYLGSTAKNIRANFEYASAAPCVLFLDEFDALAKLRDDAQEMGELKRVVNSFLQNIDTIGHDSVVIAATNHPQLLDPAVWRRFSYRIELAKPDATLRENLWREFLGTDALTDHEFAAFADLADGLTGADIREASLRARRASLVSGQALTAASLFATLLRVGSAVPDRGLVTELAPLPPHEVATTLKRRSSKIYSHSTIASLLGTSKASAFRWTRDIAQED